MGTYHGHRPGGLTVPNGVWGRIVGDDEDQVRRTLAGYCQFLDDGDFDRWIELFAEDARLVFADQVADGRRSIRTLMERMQPPEGRGKHITANILIDVEADSATARTDYLFVRPSGRGPVPVAIGRYDDELVRDGDRWRFTTRTISILGAPAATAGD
jgi:3-phenylpropionate/cinnamic acid dioxygenase small subunit